MALRKHYERQRVGHRQARENTFGIQRCVDSRGELDEPVFLSAVRNTLYFRGESQQLRAQRSTPRSPWQHRARTPGKQQNPCIKAGARFLVKARDADATMLTPSNRLGGSGANVAAPDIPASTSAKYR